MLGANDLALLRALAATPRFTGSDGLAVARAVCAEQLTAAGYSVREHPFAFSTLPARFGMPLVGGLTVVFLGSAWWSASHAAVVVPLLVLVAGAVLTRLVATWLTGPGALLLPAGVAHGVNLEAIRGDTPPGVWLVAHLDSKSQSVSLALRAAALTCLIGAWVVGGAAAAALLAGVAAIPLSLGAGLALAGGLPLFFARIGSHSCGAVDNASGVAAVIAAARVLADAGGVGILIADAEELGLAGAHAWARGRAPGVAINCDTVDDGGTVRALWTKSVSAALAGAVTRSAASIGMPCETGRLPRGILTDGVALERAGWSCVTVSRATWSTLSRIHTRRDSLEHLEGAGVGPVAMLLAAAARTAI